MSETLFKGTTVQLIGNFPKVEQTAPDFVLVKQDLTEYSLADVKQTYKLLNIFPSLDTEVCSKSIHTFYEKTKAKQDLCILNISMDLPFAAKRFCTTENLNVVTLSAFRSPFAKDYGVLIEDSPLKGLCARAVIILDETNRVIYTELVSEITHEPNYDLAISSV